MGFKGGKIYRIVSPQTINVYIGSTEQYHLCHRYANHVEAYINWKNNNNCEYWASFEILKYNDAKIELLERYTDHNTDELRKREQYWIDNTPLCVNIQPAFTTAKYSIDGTRIAFVYQLVSDQTEQVYVGSTFESTRIRFNMHRRDYNKWVNDTHHYLTSFIMLDFDDCDIELLETYNVKNLEELRMHEQEWIDKTPNCVNKCRAYTSEEQKKAQEKARVLRRKKEMGEEAWRERNKNYRNKESYKETKKKYRETNKEKLKLQDKEWYEKNKEKLIEQRKKRYEQNKEKITIQNKEYLEKNKEKIALHRKEYDQKNKDKTNERRRNLTEKRRLEKNNAEN